MATQKEEIIVRAGFDNTALASGLRTTTQRMQEFASHVGKMIAGAFAAEKLFEFQKGILEFAKNISLTSERLGITTAEVQKLQYAGALAGVQLDTIAAALDRLAKAKEKILNGDDSKGKVLAAFEKFGIAIKDIQTLAPIDLFNKIAESVSKTGANAEVTAEAMELFGRSGGKLIPLLKELRETSNQAPIISDGDLQRIKHASEDLEALEMQMKGFFATLESRLFDGKTWHEFFYSIRHPFTTQDEIVKLFGDIDKMTDKQKAEYYKSHPDKNPTAINQGTEDQGEASDETQSDGPNLGSKKSNSSSDLYLRRAQLIREIHQLGGVSYGQFQKLRDEYTEIQDKMDVENAPTEIGKLKVERNQVLRNLKEVSSQLPRPELRGAQAIKETSLKDRLAGINAMITDKTKSQSEIFKEHAEKQTKALEKISGAVGNKGFKIEDD